MEPPHTETNEFKLYALLSAVSTRSSVVVGTGEGGSGGAVEENVLIATSEDDGQ